MRRFLRWLSIAAIVVMALLVDISIPGTAAVAFEDED